ncbi:hypothetical protein Zmor_018700 [Zophobas morio]|uniref:Uncharacterized protein n=1 Tax=Zophobas morio TaxID=2755281 RepID=A0AA38MDY9_9CUCU|nr:hypothetical protein Zmor_018700 [Zophobas morio]
MLKATLKAKENIDIEKFGAVISYIKKLNVGYRGKKSNVLTREEIKTFLQEADDGEYLFEKVALIFGIAGACRKAELCAMRFDDIQDCVTFELWPKNINNNDKKLSDQKKVISTAQAQL